MSIFDSTAVWRKTLQPAYYNNCRFHMETGTMEGGRRIVLHQFPKQNVPYAEDMGGQAHSFTIRGYIVMYPYDVPGFPLYQNDFRTPRDQLIAQLETEGPGQLQLPTQKDVKIVVPVRYRLTEEERFGGYCVIDMTFMDAGIQPAQLAQFIATSIALQQAQQSLMQQNERALALANPSLGNMQI
jgi:prophage DNA circulation protein